MSIDILRSRHNFIYWEPKFDTEETQLNNRSEFGVPLPEIGEGETLLLIFSLLNS